MSKYFRHLSVATFTALGALTTQAISLDLVSISGPNAASRGYVRFDGVTDSFSFVNVTAAGPTAGFSFSLSGSDGTGDSFGDYGTINGVFKIGAITTAGTKQIAPVTLLSGPGTLVINDGTGFSLAGQIDWLEIFTDGTAGGLNSGGSINLKNVTYGGTESDLIALMNDASVTLQFGFNPAKTLSDLVADTVLVSGARVANVNISSYTGDISASAVPEAGSTFLLAASAFLGTLGFATRSGRKGK